MTEGPLTPLVVISAGAAQSVVQQVAAELLAEGSIQVSASFGAVGAQKARVISAQAADVVVLTQAMIDELIASGHVVAGTRMDLGAVCGGIAVARGRPHPDVATRKSFAAALLASTAIYLPDPAIATAGIQFLAMCEKLSIATQVRPKLRTFPNGFTAMTSMAQAGEEGALGYTQVTEIMLVEGVELVAPVPKPLQSVTIYSLGLATRCMAPDAAREFASRLAGPNAAARLAAAGFGMGV